MGLSVKEAYEVLELPLGADKDSLQSSYKKLATKWHPQKHRNSDESVWKFQQVNTAFRKLTVKETHPRVMTMTEMLLQYEKLCTPRTTASNGYNCSGSSSDYEDDDFKSLPTKKQESQKNKNVSKQNMVENNKKISEEEKDRQKKADKRRAKKKKKKEKKKAERELQLNDADRKFDNDDENIRTRNNEDESNSSAVSEEEDLDPNSAFVAMAASKNKKMTSVGVQKISKSSKKEKLKDGKINMQKDHEDEDNIEEISPVVLQSRQLAIRGNEMANVGHYSAAVGLFTEAIKLDPRDYRFFGNRSYCFERLIQYDKALRDAETAINLSSTWPKGYFRKGRALGGLKLYAEAEQAFEQVLKLDKNCDDAVQELLRVRTYQLTDMGFPKPQAEAAIRQFGTVQSALDSLLAGVVAESSTIANEVYVSDGEEFNSDDDDFRNNSARLSAQSDDKMNPRNPEGLTSLWVGNVAPEVTEKMLVSMFSKYGTVTSVRLLSDKHCSFINFKEKLAAGRAMECLQGKDCFGEKLLVRFPDNPIVNGQTTTILKKSKSTTSTKVQQQQQQQQQQQIQQQILQQQNSLQQKQTGPVNGDECYFWRTTGCIYSDKCRFRHVKEHRGVDKKPWQKPTPT